MTSREGRMNSRMNPDLWCCGDSKREMNGPAVCRSKILCFRLKESMISAQMTSDLKKKEVYRRELIRSTRTGLTTYIHWPTSDDDCFIINRNNYDSVLLDLMTLYVLPMFPMIFLFVLTDYGISRSEEDIRNLQSTAGSYVAAVDRKAHSDNSCRFDSRFIAMHTMNLSFFLPSSSSRFI